RVGGVLWAAGPARRGARGQERGERPQAELGEAAARPAPAARLSVVSLGQVARRRPAAGRGFRSLVLCRGPRAILPPAGPVRGRSPAPARLAGERVLHHRRDRPSCHWLSLRPRLEAPRPVLLPLTRLSPPP